MPYIVSWPRNRQSSLMSFSVALVFATLLAGCARVPYGPTVRFVPGPGKSVAQFQTDDLNCRSLSGSQVMPQTLAVSPADQLLVQQVYDNSYTQCMTSSGHVVPRAAGPAPVGPNPALVRAVQDELARLGYLDVPPDGAYGPMTRSAIQAFERANSLPVTGAVTQNALARMRASVPGGNMSASPPPNMSPNVGPNMSPNMSPNSGPSWVAPTTARPGAATPQPAQPPPAAPPSGWVSPVRPQ